MAYDTHSASIGSALDCYAGGWSWGFLARSAGYLRHTLLSLLGFSPSAPLVTLLSMCAWILHHPAPLSQLIPIPLTNIKHTGHCC